MLCMLIHFLGGDQCYCKVVKGWRMREHHKQVCSGSICSDFVGLINNLPWFKTLIIIIISLCKPLFADTLSTSRVTLSWESLDLTGLWLWWGQEKSSLLTLSNFESQWSKCFLWVYFLSTVFYLLSWSLICDSRVLEISHVNIFRQS